MNIKQIKTTLVHLHLTINLPDFQGKLENHIFNDKSYGTFVSLYCLRFKHHCNACKTNFLVNIL